MADLKEYRRKRDFGKTAEPKGGEAEPSGGEGGVFVVHKHAASRLHYDLRLEQGGVLWSWAVTRGPSLDPAEKRLAVHVEDHPLDYAPFEGTIPEGQYGGGAVIVWDEGRWSPEGDAADGMEKGRLSFSLAGSKLKGAWHLVKMKKRKGDNWLLIKDDDAFARADGDILAERPLSVRSGKTVEEVGGKEAPPAPPRRRKPAARKTAAKPLEATAPGEPKGGSGKLTHPDKLLWPEAGISKGGLLRHYEQAWERMRSFLVDRPLTLVRSPDGRKRFFQQHAWAGMPDAIHRMRDPTDDAELLFVRDFEGLAALVQFGTVEIHVWGAKTGALTLPDQITFDLDPDEGMGAGEVRAAALEIKARLETHGLEPFLKTSGGKGFHIVAPLAPGAGWEAVEKFTSGLVHAMAADAPDRFTAASVLAEREGRIFIDYLRNNPNATTVAPWSSRAKPKATVSVPIPWEALGKGAGPADYTLGSAQLDEALRAPDPWSSFWEMAEPLRS